MMDDSSDRGSVPSRTRVTPGAARKGNMGSPIGRGGLDSHSIASSNGSVGSMMSRSTVRPRPSSATRARPAETSNSGGARAIAAQALSRDPASVSSARGQSSTQVLLEQVRAKIVQRGGSNGIKTLGKLLAIMDDNGDKRLTKDEFR